MDLSAILNEEFPELSVDIASSPLGSDIEFEELKNALQYIKRNKLVQDAEDLLSGVGPMSRSSVTYPIIFPEQNRDLSFEVKWIQGPMLYIGNIQTKNPVGDDVILARMYGVRIKHES